MGPKNERGRAAAKPDAVRGDLFSRMLGIVERAGNALPHPATIFLLLALAVLGASAIGSWAGLSAVHP